MNIVVYVESSFIACMWVKFLKYIDLYQEKLLECINLKEGRYYLLFETI